MKVVRALMAESVEAGVFPGAVLLAAEKNRIVFFEAFGRARLLPERPMTSETVFDLASLTKPMATAVSLMLLVQQEKLTLDQTLGSAIADFSGTVKEDITIRQLLSHTAGLPDYRPYYKRLMEHPPSERKSVFHKLLVREELVHVPGHACLYSDLGFMILQWVVEVCAEKALEHLVEESVYGLLKLRNLFYIPSNSGNGRGDKPFAATEDCPWRGKVLEAEVHDENAYAVGGVAGHAGLFGTARDVYRLLQELLNTYLDEPNTGLFRRDVVETFFQRQPHGESWALGFDTPTPPDSSSGQYFSERSVGHLGFTGTSFWMDLDRAIVVVLLTNRIHPTRENEEIKAFRPVLHDAVMDALVW
jgi:CubicO group peptidase (beta-lactamase class C family)